MVINRLLTGMILQVAVYKITPISRVITPPKNPDPSKVAILRTRTPAIQVQTLPLEGPRILRAIYNWVPTFSLSIQGLPSWCPIGRACHGNDAPSGQTLRQVDTSKNEEIIPGVFQVYTWQFFMTFLGWLSDPFKWLSDLQQGMIRSL